MHRCYVDPSQWSQGPVVLGSQEAHHLVHVMRARPGDRISAFDGCGHEAEGCLEIKGPGTDGVVVRLSGEHFRERSRVALTLVQAIPKGGHMDLVVEKATELGVDTIVPAVTERVIGRPDQARADKRARRWQRVALGASRQSRRAWLPEVLPPCSWEQALSYGAVADLFLVASLEPDALQLRSVLEPARLPGTRSAVLLVGPEGDLTAAEHAAASEAGGIAVTFGAGVMRTETAALYGLSVLVYELRGTDVSRSSS